MLKVTLTSRARAARLLAALALTAVAGGGVLAPGPAAANVRVAFPADAPGPPYYARLSSAGAPQTDEWAAIVFYRDPSCVPPTFNLLAFFDAPRALGCELTVEGFEIWRNGPGIDPAPIVVNSRGLGEVPVWFVAVSELEAASADGVLTIAELAALPSLQQGHADRFHEVLHPSQAARNSKLTITAAGVLSDGRRFALQVSASREVVRNVRISFG